MTALVAARPRGRGGLVAVAGLAGLPVAAALVLFLGGGSGAEGSGRLAFAGEPQVYRSPSVATDLALSARVRNDSLRKLELDAKDIRVLDARGRELPSTALYGEGYGHRAAPMNLGRDIEPQYQDTNLGETAKLEPGQTSPLTVSWREERGRPPAARIDYGRGQLPLP